MNQYEYEYEYDDDEDDYMADDDGFREADYEPGICPACNGSGEGQHDGTRCSMCRGRGGS